MRDKKQKEKQMIETTEESIKNYILQEWTRDKVISFAKDLLGDECQNKIYCPRT